jgi:hypothetical protein
MEFHLSLHIFPFIDNFYFIFTCKYLAILIHFCATWTMFLLGSKILFWYKHSLCLQLMNANISLVLQLELHCYELLAFPLVLPFVLELSTNSALFWRISIAFELCKFLLLQNNELWKNNKLHCKGWRGMQKNSKWW